jgi:hypothetical protein
MLMVMTHWIGTGTWSESTIQNAYTGSHKTTLLLVELSIFSGIRHQVLFQLMELLDGTQKIDQLILLATLLV